MYRSADTIMLDADILATFDEPITTVSLKKTYYATQISSSLFLLTGTLYKSHKHHPHMQSTMRALRRLNCLGSRLFLRQLVNNKESKAPYCWSFCESNPPMTSGLPTQRGNNADCHVITYHINQLPAKILSTFTPNTSFERIWSNIILINDTSKLFNSSQPVVAYMRQWI